MSAWARLHRWICVLLLCAAAPAWAALADDLQGLLDSQQLSGAVVALVDGERTELLAAGRFRRGGEEPLRSVHRVQVASIAKTVVALAVLRLATQGRVDLDAPLADVLPAVALDNPWPQQPVRVRQLLDMTAGLPDVQLWHVFNRRHRADQPLALALRPERGPLRLRSEPGRQFSYSNLSFVLAAMVVEAITGERYAAWAERELLRPLGMLDSRLVFRSQAADPLLAWGHQDDGTPLADTANAVMPAAHLHTTTADMARLMRFLLGDGRLEGAPFIAAGWMEALGHSPSTDAARAGLRSGYGLGLFTRDRHGAIGLCHGGSAAGWRAMLCVYRAQQRGFFFALNQDREAADPALVEARLVQQLGVAQPLPAPSLADTPGVPVAHARWHGLYLPDPSRLQAMALPERLFGFWWLELRPGAPATLRQGLFGPVRPLHPAGPNLYRQADRQQATLALLQSADGRTLRLGGSYLTLRQEPLVRQALLWVLALFGALGALSLLPLAAWRAWRHGWRGWLVRVPTALALLLVAAALSAWLLRGWQQLGEPGAAAVGLLLASLLLAAAAAWQAWRGWQAGHRPETWSAIGTLLFVGLCAGHGWWPVVAWRI